MTFQNSQDFIWNQLNVNLCGFWITLDEALQDGFGDKCPNRDSPLDDFRAIFFMFRCAFAHKISQPTWKVGKAAYRRRPYCFSVPQEYRNLGFDELYFDFAALDGQRVRNEQMKAFPGLFFFAQMTCKLLAERSSELLNESTKTVSK
ncbi:MAG: hypothetical protein JSS32_07530 [Verrucomicrobia bacterium]|nr:hypothetical protein [Verrucomicrobiota bacterium]